MASQSSPVATAKALARLIARIMQSDEIDGDVVAEDGSKYRVVRRRPPDSVVTITPIAPRLSPALEVRMFALDDERPPEYPASLPVVAGSRVVIIAALDGSRRHVAWSNLPDPASAVAEIVRHSLDDGWERTETGNPMVSLRRGDAARALLYGFPLEEGHVQLLEFASSG